jgi:uncharacterized repeat protein (TIGR04138 family)
MPDQPLKPIEDIVLEVGRYPLDAFIFIQECIGEAAKRVHGPMSPDQVAVAQWMSQNDLGPEELVAQWESGGLPDEVAAAVERMGGPQQMNRHVTGQELCRAVRDAALERWGLMARGVLARWEITRTEDIGTIVFALVDNHWLSKQPTDTIDDFHNVFPFAEAFDKQYQIGQ